MAGAAGDNALTADGEERVDGGIGVDGVVVDCCMGCRAAEVVCFYGAVVPAA